MGLFGNTTWGDRLKGNLKAAVRFEGVRAGWEYSKEYAQKRIAKEEQELRKLCAQVALRAFNVHQGETSSSQSVMSNRNEVQYEDGDVRVFVKSDWSRDQNCATTNIKVIHRSPKIKEHLHIVFDEAGNVIYESWNSDH